MESTSNYTEDFVKPSLNAAGYELLELKSKVEPIVLKSLTQYVLEEQFNSSFNIQKSVELGIFAAYIRAESSCQTDENI